MYRFFCNFGYFVALMLALLVPVGLYNDSPGQAVTAGVMAIVFVCINGYFNHIDKRTP